MSTHKDKPITTKRHALEESDEITAKVEVSMRRLAVIARVVGWAWMLMLVIATLSVDSGADRSIVIAAMVLATVWTAVTLWAARSQRIFASPWFLSADVLVALLVGGASWAAGADNLFHGGYLIPTLAVAAYGTNLWGVTFIASFVAIEQAAILISWGKGPVPALSSLGFIVWGLVFGWMFSAIRKTDVYRRATVDELMIERETAARNSERLELASQLHDSALQTLQVIDENSQDAERVRELARREARELRRLVDTYSMKDETTLRDELLDAASWIEELFDTEVSAVIRVDVVMDHAMHALLGAAREAMTNSAKYSGSDRIDLYAAMEDDVVAIYVRDEGRGFDVDTAELGHGIEQSIRRRVAEVGGEVCIESMPGEGTEVKVSAMPQLASV